MSARALAVVTALALAACGAKTALDVSGRDAEVARDAGPVDAGDAGAFRTFPCRWFPEPPNEIPLGRVDGAAVSAELERIVLVGPAPGGVGARWVSYIPRATPVLEGSFEVPWAGPTRSIVPRRGGWLVTASEDGATCALHWVSPRVELERTRHVAAERGACELEPIDLDHAVLRVAVSASERAVVILDTADGTSRELARATQPLAATRGTDGTELAVVAEGGEWEGRARRGDDRTLIARWPRAGGASAQLAPDRLLGGAILLTDAGEELVLERLRVEGDRLVREPLATTAGPMGVHDLVTNETEALFSLASGAFVAVPVHTGDVRIFAPPPGPVRDARIVIAPGASVAVQLWRGEADRQFMRSLVCNR